MHPLLKPYNLFYSNGVAILSGCHDIPQYKFFKIHPLPKSHILFYSNGLAILPGLPIKGHAKVNNGPKTAILNLIKSQFFKMHPLPKSHILFYSNGLAI